MRKREVKPYSKKKCIIIITISILLLVVALVLFAIGSELQKKGAESIVYLPLCISMLPICIFCIVFLLHHTPGILAHEFDTKVEKINKRGYETINTYVDDINIYCYANNFTLHNEGYYHRRKFTIWKEYINYYVQKVYSTDIEQTLDSQFEKIDSAEFEKNNKCYVLFIEKENITEEDLQFLIEKSTVFIAGGVFLQVSAFIVLLDRTKRCAYCIPSCFEKLSLYNYGYKLAKKIMNVDKK